MRTCKPKTLVSFSAFAFATPGSRRVRAPLEVATTPRRSVRIEKRKQKSKDATTQEFLARTLCLLEKNTEFDNNALASFNDKFKTPFVASVHHVAWLPCEENGEGEKVQRQKG
jgi:hypothetical protein